MRRDSSMRWPGAAGLLLLVLLLSACRLPTVLLDRDRESEDPTVTTEVLERQPPIELVWAGRPRPPDQVVDFTRPLGWRVEQGERVTAQFGRTAQRPLWDDYVGEFTFRSARPAGWARLVPPQPVPVDDPVDTLTLWIGTASPVPAAAPVLTALFETAAGEPAAVVLGPIDWTGWRMVQRRLPSALQATEAYPIRLTGLRWDSLHAPEPHALYLAGLRLFMDRVDPIRYPRRARRPLPLSDGQLEGINTGEGELDFPVTLHTVVPPTAEPGQVQIEPQAGGHYLLQAGGVAYRIATEGGITPIEVWHDGAPTGIRWETLEWQGLDQTDADPAVVRVAAEHLYVEYRRGDAYRLTVRGGSLVVDVSCRGRSVEEVRLTGLTLPASTRAVSLPFLHGADAAVSPLLVLGDEAAPLFVHGVMDHYRSNGSVLFFDEEGEGATWSLGARYRPTTAGHRNDVHERFVLSVAGQIDHVLPGLPNPAGQERAQLVSRLVTGRTSAASGFDDELATLATLSRWGIKDVLYQSDERVWREKGESVSFRLKANPFQGGDAGWADFFAQHRGQGWMPALYLDYRALSPLNAFWSRHELVRTPDGGWLADGDCGFLVNALFAATWNDEHLEKLVERFQPDAWWVGRLTAQPPWDFTDYDERVPGSATFSQVLFADGDLLRGMARRTGRPVVGQAAGARFYAGLVDGLVVDDTAGTLGDLRPYNPLFKLWRVHPLSVVFGADRLETKAQDAEALDRMLADQIAYGLAGRLVVDPDAPELTVRSYYALRALQAAYLLQRPAQIRYGDGEGAYVTPERALANGVWRRSLLYVEYPGDLEVWVNGSDSETWTVRVGADEHRIPPSGWIAAGPRLWAFSGLHEDGRIDYVDAPDYLYFDPRDRTLTYRAIRAAGPVVIAADDEGLVVLDVLKAGGIWLHGDRIPDAAGLVVACFGPQDQPLGAGRLEAEGAGWRLTGPAGTARYRID